MFILVVLMVMFTLWQWVQRSKYPKVSFRPLNIMQLHTGSHSLPKYIRGLGYLGGHAWVALFDSRTRPLKTVGFAGYHLCTDGWGGEEGAEEGTEREKRYSDFPHALKKQLIWFIGTLSSQIVYG